MRDDVMTHHSAPFKFTETGSILIRTGSGQQHPEPPSSSHKKEVCSKYSFLSLPSFPTPSLVMITIGTLHNNGLLTSVCVRKLTTCKTFILVQVPAVEVEVQVTGSANIVTFTPYYMGCVPLQLINYTSHPLNFKQM